MLNSKVHILDDVQLCKIDRSDFLFLFSFN